MEATTASSPKEDDYVSICRKVLKYLEKKGLGLPAGIQNEPNAGVLWDCFYSKEQFQRGCEEDESRFRRHGLQRGQDSWSEGANMDGNWERLAE